MAATTTRHKSRVSRTCLDPDGMGVEVDRPGSATIMSQHLHSQSPEGTRCFFIGTYFIREFLFPNEILLILKTDHKINCSLLNNIPEDKRQIK